MINRIIVFLLAAAIPLTVFDKSAAICEGNGIYLSSLTRSVHPRSAAMAQAATSLSGASEAIFDNPASLAMMNPVIDMAFAHHRWIADVLFYQGSMAIRPAGGRLGTIGISYWRKDFGKVSKLEEEYYGKTRLYYQSIGLGYALSLIPSLSLGGHARYMVEQIYPETDPFDIDNDLILYDLGLSYRPGLKSLALGFVYRSYWRNDEDKELGCMLEVGGSMDLFEVLLNLPAHSLVVALDRVYRQELDEKTEFGAEYGFRETIFIRAGFRGPEDAPERNYGVGLRIPLGRVNFQVDYTRGDMKYFGEIERFAVQFSY